MTTSTTLKKSLGPVTLWGLGVGYVISGEYFGWNLGLPIGGTYGMLAATLFVTVMYLTFILTYTELACALPRAGGAFVYCREGLGERWGAVAGFAQTLEFVFAPPAIAMALAAYVNQRYGGLPTEAVAVVAYLLFSGLNAWGVRQAALFELVVTVLAVAELLLFMGLTAPAFSTEAFVRNPLPNGWSGAFACLPFAMWFYLAIEGVANAAEEARDPGRDVMRGFTAAIITLVVLALGVYVTAVGVGGWEAIVYATPGAEPSDAPLPLALAQVVSKGSGWYTLLLGVGMLGLVASFHGIILAAGRATMEMGREGYLPRLLGKVHPRWQTPAAALAFNLVCGVVAIFTGRTAEIITLACFGAATLYVLSVTAFFKLRQNQPELNRPFRTPCFPWLPGVALGSSVVVLVALVVYHPRLFAVYAAILGAAYAWSRRGRTVPR